MFKIKGILFHVGAKQEFSSYMVKKEFIVSRMGAGAYPNTVFEVLGNEIAKLDAIPLNSHVEVNFDIHGKSYTAKNGLPKNFNVLRAFNIEPVAVIPVVAEIMRPIEEVAAELRVVAETAKPVEEDVNATLAIEAAIKSIKEAATDKMEE